MKRFIVIASLFVSGIAFGDYMKWMVDTSNVQNSSDSDAVSAMNSYAYAVLVTADTAEHGTTSLYVPPNSGVTPLSTYAGSYPDAMKEVDSSWFELGPVASDMTGASTYFFIELFDDNDKLVGYTSTGATRNDLSNFVETSRFKSQWTNMSGGWSGGSYTAVPEPTGGLMILLGAGLVALRRRKFV